MTSKTKLLREKILCEKHNTHIPLGQSIRSARKTMGLKCQFLSKCLDVPFDEWLEYEHNRKPVPANIVIKLLIFGMDFWVRNKQCFENGATLPVGDADTPPRTTHAN